MAINGGLWPEAGKVRTQLSAHFRVCLPTKVVGVLISDCVHMQRADPCGSAHLGSMAGLEASTLEGPLAPKTRLSSGDLSNLAQYVNHAQGPVWKGATHNPQRFPAIAADPQRLATSGSGKLTIARPDPPRPIACGTQSLAQ